MRVFIPALFFLAVGSVAFTQTSYTETVGDVSGIVFIPAHEAANGFDNDNLTYSGSGDVRNSAPSNGYPGASASANVLLNEQNEDFIISGLTPNASCVTIDLQFGIRKSQNAENGSGIAVEYSTNGGGTWISAGAVVLPSGAGTAGIWYLRTLTGLPGNANAFRFRKIFPTPSSSFRIDDVIITGNGTGCSLPIELAVFEAKARPDGSADLHWATASETNNDYFLLERATDDRRFVQIGRIEGAGTTTEWNEYNFRDEHPSPGRNHYRLQQVDFDGQSSYSPVRTLVFPKDDKLHVFPSPAVDNLQVQLKDVPAEAVRWEIFDAAGRLTQTGTWAGEATQFDLGVGDLPAGTYLLRLVIGREVLTRFFSKQ